MDNVTPHIVASTDSAEGLALDDSELQVQLSEFVMHPLRTLAATTVVMSSTATALSLE